MLKASKYLQAYASTALSTVANQAYIELSGIADLDEVVAVQDTTNDVTLQCIPANVYFRANPDPSNNTGTPYRYCRIFNRIYLDPRPTAIINYTVQYQKTYARLTSDADVALIPSKYDDWIYSEAKPEWYAMLYEGQVPAYILAAQADTRIIYMNDVMSDFDMVPQSESHWNQYNADIGFPNFNRPVDGT